MPNTFFKININILHKIKVINLQLIMLNFCDVFFLFMLVDSPPRAKYIEPRI